MVPRIEEPYFIARKRDLYCSLSVQLIDKYLQGILVVIRIELDSLDWPTTSIEYKVIKMTSTKILSLAGIVYAHTKLFKICHADINTPNSLC